MWLFASSFFTNSTFQFANMLPCDWKQKFDEWCEWYCMSGEAQMKQAHGNNFRFSIFDRRFGKKALKERQNRYVFSDITLPVGINAGLNNSGLQKLRSTCYKRIALRIFVTNQFLKRTKCANWIHGDNPRDFIFSLNSTGVIAAYCC